MCCLQRQEERGMWCQRRREIDELCEKKSERKRKREDRERRKYKDVHDSFRHGGYLDNNGDCQREESVEKAATSNKWAAELMRYEESLGDQRYACIFLFFCHINIYIGVSAVSIVVIDISDAIDIIQIICN